MLPFDLTATASSNSIRQETQTIGPAALPASGLIFLKYGPFFAKNLVITLTKNNGTSRQLILNTDYWLVGRFQDVAKVIGGVYCAIYIASPDLMGTWTCDYQALGGSPIIDKNQFVDFLSSASSRSRVGLTVCVPSDGSGLTINTNKDLSDVQNNFAAIPISLAFELIGSTIAPSTPTPSPNDGDQTALAVANRALLLAQQALFTLPVASASTLGGVKQGSGIIIDLDGTIHAPPVQAGVSSVNGRTGEVSLNLSDITGLGSAASQSSSAFATSVQGIKADTAIQSVNGLTGSAITLTAASLGALSLTAADARYASVSQGAVADTAVQSINGKSGNAITLAAADIGGLASSATVDTTNAFNITTGVFNKSLFPSLDTTDITGLGTAALQPATAFATAAQGVTADLALAGLADKQNVLSPGSNVSIVNNTISFNSTGQYRPVKQADTAMILDVTPIITSTLILPANNQRVGLLIDNPSNATLYISFGEPVTETRYSVRIAPQEQYETGPFVFIGAIYGMWSEAALEPAIITELTDSALGV